MDTQPPCFDCFLRQADDATRRCGIKGREAKQIRASIDNLLKTQPPEATPPELASQVHARVRELTGNPDPYAEAKREATDHALALYPQLKERIEQSDDPLATAVRLAIAGNIIDLGVSESYDLEASIERVLNEPLTVDQTPALKAALEKAEWLLYLGDNAGETVFDRLLIERLNRPVTYIAKGGPAVNDATVDDAKLAGIDRVATVLPSGAATLGTLLDQCTPEVNELFQTAPLVISKGMANYEALHGSRSGLFFLLQVKCGVVASHLGIAEKSLVVMEDEIA